MQEAECLPTKVKRSESGIGWRRKNSKHTPKRPSTPPSLRPTLLLPPMRCTGGGLYVGSNGCPPVVTTHIQQVMGRDNNNISNNFHTLDNNLRCQTFPEPTAPSPGPVFHNSEDKSDIAFIVGHEEKWRIPAHRFILEKTAPTLQALLQAGCRDQVEDDTSPSELVSGDRPRIVLRLPDMQPEVFDQMLRYIYTGQVSFSSVESTLQLLQECQIYHLSQLTSHCLEYISKNVSPVNVLTVLSCLLSPKAPSMNPATEQNEPQDNHDNERNELILKCFLIVDGHADRVFQSDAFEKLDRELMMNIVKRPTLKVTSEAVILDAVIRWACRMCKKERKELTLENQRSVLGMTPEEFLLERGKGSHYHHRAIRPERACAVPLPDTWSSWKPEERSNARSSVASPPSELPSTNTESPVSPSNSVQPVNASKRNEKKKKSMSKKLLSGVGDIVICVIQLLD